MVSVLAAMFATMQMWRVLLAALGSPPTIGDLLAAAVAPFPAVAGSGLLPLRPLPRADPPVRRRAGQPL